MGLEARNSNEFKPFQTDAKHFFKSSFWPQTDEPAGGTKSQQPTTINSQTF